MSYSSGPLSPSPPNREAPDSPAMVLLNALGPGAARLFFYPSLLYTMVRERLPGSNRPWFSRIDHAVLLGALPLRRWCRQLVEKENVRGVLTMNEEYETRFLCYSPQEWEAMGVEQLRLSTVDLTGIPSLENLHKGVNFVLKHRDSGNSVYVHCKAGRFRSATMVAAYLIQIFSAILTSGAARTGDPRTERGFKEDFGASRSRYTGGLHQWTPQEAIEAITKIRPHIIIRHKQIQLLEDFHRSITVETQEKPVETRHEQKPPEDIQDPTPKAPGF